MFAYCLNSPTNANDALGDIAVFDDIVIFGTVLVVIVVLIIAAPPTQELFHSTAEATANFLRDLSQIGADITESKKPVNLPSFKKLRIDVDHILSGHTPNGSRNPDGKKTVFWGMTTQQILKAITEAYNNSSKLQTQGERILVRGFSYTYNLLIEIWVNLKEMIIETAYPIN